MPALESFTAADDVCLVIKDFGVKNVYAGQTLASHIKAAQAQPNAPEILYLDSDLPPEQLAGIGPPKPSPGGRTATAGPFHSPITPLRLSYQ